MTPTIALCAIAAASALLGIIFAVKHRSYVSKHGKRGNWPSTTETCYLFIADFFLTVATILLIAAYQLGAA
jgi:hypothetical protein